MNSEYFNILKFHATFVALLKKHLSFIWNLNLMETHVFF